MTDDRIIEAVQHLQTHGPTTTYTKHPCAYDVAQYLQCANGLYPDLSRIAKAGRLVERPCPQGDIYPPEFSVPS